MDGAFLQQSAHGARETLFDWLRMGLVHAAMFLKKDHSDENGELRPVSRDSLAPLEPAAFNELHGIPPRARQGMLWASTLYSHS